MPPEPPRKKNHIAPPGHSPGTDGSATSLRMSRRTLLVGGLAAAGVLGASYLRDLFRQRAPVFIARHQRYDDSLVRTIHDGLTACGIDAAALKNKRVLLKPNLVEPMREAPHMTTHPAVVLAAAEVFRRWGAHVVVGEAPGHVRDTEMALDESGFAEALDSIDLTFADLNYTQLAWVPNAGRTSKLDGFYFPQEVADADLIVSMPKMKTHHWVGVTAAMKNLYGVIPGIKYGWPKNVLHHNGIPQTVVDINASLPRTITVVDGIECMEGDGPILGTAKSMGVVLVGPTPTSVDATVCRLMDIEPERVSYLQLAAQRLGPIDDRLIEQRGEPWESLVSPFKILDRPHLRRLRDHGGPLVS